MKSRISTVRSLFKAGSLALLLAPALGAAQGANGPVPPGAGAQAAGRSPAGGGLDVEGRREISPKKPVDIRSDRLNFDQGSDLTLFEGNVRLTHDDLVLTSDQLSADSSRREATAMGNVKVDDLRSDLHLTCGNLDYQDEEDRITAHDHPLLHTRDENGGPVTIRSRQMELYAGRQEVIAHQDVEILNDQGRSEAQLATFYSDGDRLILEESPRVFTPQGVITGRRITTSLAQGDHRIVVDGMAEAEFYGKTQAVPDKPSGVGSSTPLPPGMGVAAPAAPVPPPAATPVPTPGH